MNRQEFLEKVLQNDAVKSALSYAKTEKEAHAAQAAVKELVGNFFDSFSSVITAVQKDSNLLNKAATEFDDQIINKEGSNKKAEDK